MAEDEFALVLQQRAVVLELRLVGRGDRGEGTRVTRTKPSRLVSAGLWWCCRTGGTGAFTSLFIKAKKSVLTKPGLASSTALT